MGPGLGRQGKWEKALGRQLALSKRTLREAQNFPKME